MAGPGLQLDAQGAGPGARSPAPIVPPDTRNPQVAQTLAGRQGAIGRNSALPSTAPLAEKIDGNLPIDALSLDKLLQEVSPEQRLEQIKRENGALQTVENRPTGEPAPAPRSSQTPTAPTATPEPKVEEKAEIMPPQPEIYGTEAMSSLQEVPPAKKGWDWAKIGEIAAATGMGLAEILQSALAGRQAAVAGQKFDFEGDTSIGRRKAKEREDQLNAQQEATAKATRGEERDYEKLMVEADRMFQAEQSRINQEFQAKMAEAQTAQQRQEAAENYRREMSAMAQKFEYDKTLTSMARQPATATAGGDRFGMLGGQ